MPRPTKQMQAAARSAKKERLKYTVASRPLLGAGVALMNQIINNVDMSIETVMRVYNFLNRQLKNYNPGERDSQGRQTKGTIAVNAWGGPSALKWAANILFREGKINKDDLVRSRKRG